MTININELRRLTQAATLGGWYIKRGNHIYGCKEVTDGIEKWHPLIACTEDDEVNVNFEANAAFIAAANPEAISELLDRLEAAEEEAAHQKALADSALRVAEGWEEKCNSLRAKIERMEQQEPARLVTPTAYRWRYRGAIKWQYGELTEETARVAGEHNHEVQPLFTLPGAQPAPSVPDFANTKDAARYRWLRENGLANEKRESRAVLPRGGKKASMAFRYWTTPEELDMTIDAMLSAAPEAKP